MELKEMVELEMENISKADIELVEGMEYLLGWCGTIGVSSSGSCGEDLN